jgi:hypothetical protein
VNVTNPSASYEVAFIAGLTSIWREMKQYRDYIYISTEADGGGIQIVKMTDPESPVLVNTYATNFNRAHTLEVDSTRALLYCNGTRAGLASAGMRILSLADPEHPMEVGAYGADYVHDCFPAGRARAASRARRCASWTSRTRRRFEIASWTYPPRPQRRAVARRAALHLRRGGLGTMKVFDITSLSAPVQVNEVVVNPLGIAHNIHVRGDIGYMAYYTEGVRLFDLADPAYPAEFGHFDTYPGFSGGFNGVWEVAPFYPSGPFIASDIRRGPTCFGWTLLRDREGPVRTRRGPGRRRRREGSASGDPRARPPRGPGAHAPRLSLRLRGGVRSRDGHAGARIDRGHALRFRLGSPARAGRAILRRSWT